MSDDLEKLSDAQLSEVFAVEVDTCTPTKTPDIHTTDGFRHVWHDELKGRTFVSSPYMAKAIGLYAHSWHEAKFATSADAVLKFLQVEGIGWSVDAQLNDIIEVNVWPAANFPYGPFTGISHGKGFARAACISLIRAKRAQK